MSTNVNADPTPAVKARRGDLAVVVSKARSAVVQGESREGLRVTLGRVSSVTRTGLVKRYEEAMFADADDREQKVQPRDQVLVVGAESVDVEAVLVQYREHTWRATAGSDSDMVRPYSSMTEVRDAIRPWRYPQS